MRNTAVYFVCSFVIQFSYISLVTHIGSERHLDFKPRFRISLVCTFLFLRSDRAVVLCFHRTVPSFLDYIIARTRLVFNRQFVRNSQ